MELMSYGMVMKVEVKVERQVVVARVGPVLRQVGGQVPVSVTLVVTVVGSELQRGGGLV